MTLEHMHWWCARLGMGVDMQGRGKDISNVEVKFSEVWRYCRVDETGHTGPFDETEVADATGNSSIKGATVSVDENYWWQRKESGDKTEKHFKTGGILNGDVLELEPGGCKVFKSPRARLVVEWCQKAMR